MHISNIKKLLTLAASVPFMYIVSGCADEIAGPVVSSGDEIGFTTTIRNSWAPGGGSRAAVDSRTQYLGGEAVNASEPGDYYVHTTLDNFDASTTDASRAMPVESAASLTSVDLTAYAYNGDWATTTDKKEFFKGLSLTQNGGKWQTNPTHYWPAMEETVRFVAYANMPRTGGTSGNTLSMTNDKLSFEYTVSKDVANQNDILAVAMDANTAEHRKNNGLVKIPLNHILTGVQFRTAKGSNESEISEYTIRSVGFKNVVNKATFTNEPIEDGETLEEAGKRLWTIKSGGTGRPITDFSITINTTNDNPIAADTPITTPEQTLMMIPQEFGDDAQVTITLVDKDGRELVIVKSLKGSSWPMGSKVTYIISTQSKLVEELFEVYLVERSSGTGGIVTEELMPDKYTWNAPLFAMAEDGTTNGELTSHFRVRSVRRTYSFIDASNPANNRVEDIDLNWTSSGQPTWMNLSATSGKGEATYFTMALKQRAVTSREDAWTKKLQDNETFYNTYHTIPNNGNPGGAGYYDLSLQYSNGNTKVRNTANCYIINAPGKYRFPLVYGNAIVNNKVNREAYGQFYNEETKQYVRIEDSPFKNVNGMDISSPALSTATHPVLFWADNQQLASALNASLDWQNNKQDLGLDGETVTAYYAIFEIKEEDMRQGNAMVGVTNGTFGGIFWSWHLWFCPYSPNNYNNINESGDAAEVNLHNNEKFSYGGTEYEMMPYNLGWCDRVTLNFGNDNRVADLVFTQTETGRTISIKVDQDAGSEIQYGNNILYQFGRKDPLRGSYMYGQSEPHLKPFYHVNNGEVEEYKIYPRSGLTTVSKVLNEPPYVYVGNAVMSADGHTVETPDDGGEWCSTTYDTLWYIDDEFIPAGCKRQTDGKTIFDPSPAGYRVPDINALRGAMQSGMWINTPINGAHFATNNIYFPVSAYRNLYAQLEEAGQGSYLLTANPDGVQVPAMYLHVDKLSAGLGLPAVPQEKMISRIISGAVRPIRDRAVIIP